VSAGSIIIRCRSEGKETEEEELYRRVFNIPTFLISWFVVSFFVLAVLLSVSLVAE